MFFLSDRLTERRAAIEGDTYDAGDNRRKVTEAVGLLTVRLNSMIDRHHWTTQPSLAFILIHSIKTRFVLTKSIRWFQSDLDPGQLWTYPTGNRKEIDEQWTTGGSR
jgi:hypothetical protein